ncbi:predicted protein [Sclerotinia sclerotiorum 1980 UF-70]|uniref:Uncharacterized protein n=1 Tax=Sclerotinia sclerotiorum (strain ATCC 18683 / 1980 / Ss-1) TaxID=665079 RepID=A7EA29_SCLS1|nr:predicted protein [Sclerotinia sclerotiorum 1980 UF-70]EDN99307.1 predicted protein [Sclerotinia sclerotiorum 1980 UF-70]
MDETAKLAKLYSRKKYIDEYDTKDSGVITPEEEILSSTEFCSTVFVMETFRDAPPGISRFHDDNSLATTLVYCLGCKVKGDLIPLWLLGSFYQHIPGRLGHSIALDDAVSCLAVNIDKGRWGDLARGTAKLIQARGVYRHTDPFDLGMLESQLSYIV